MMRQHELVERVRQYNPDTDADFLDRAYVFAMKAHGGQRRASGDPYFSHPLEVAGILTELRLDDATIAAALLHDTIEDTVATREEIDEHFGDEIGSLVDGLTKLAQLDLVTKKAEQAENFRKLLLAISDDVRVLLVKLADRLHNMRTLEHMRADKRERISRETLEIYAPLAGRMGMQHVREELEDHSFRWVYPEAYEVITQRLKGLCERNADLVEIIRGALEERLDEEEIKATIAVRQKKPYSVWMKMEAQQISMEQLSDIFGFRIICDDVLDCYKILGVIHSRWRAVPGRFKDYVSNPKRNDYRSLHTTIVGPRHQRVELQIRTHEMHEVAEYGVAAHAGYKEGGGNRSDTRAYDNLRKLVDTLLEGDDPDEFLEHTKLELVTDQVFCFTPKGDLIALPKGATPIDFAYAVHTDVGNTCVGSLINRRQQPLVTRLENGDEVQILRSDGQASPPLAWEKIVKTGRARSAIRRANRELQYRKYKGIGQTILQAAFERAGKAFSVSDIEAKTARFSQKNANDILVAVGRGELGSGEVLHGLYPELEPEQQLEPDRSQRNRMQRRQDDGWFNLRKVIGLKFRLPGRAGNRDLDAVVPAPVRGQSSDIPVEMQRSYAIPGDRIVGIMTPGQGIRIYPIDSPDLAQFDDQLDRWIDVNWDLDDDRAERYLARIRVEAVNEPGTLAQLAHVIADADGNIDTLAMLERGPDFTVMQFEIEVWNLKHLNEIMKGLRARPVVSSVERMYS